MSFIEATTKHQPHPASTTWKPNRPRPKRGRRKPQRRFPPEVLSDREIAALIDACKDDTPAGLRNRALIAILYRAGLRITEALALRPIDVDPGNGAIRILHAKGGRSRTVGMDAVGFEILARWLQARTSLPVGEAGPLFCLVNGKQMASCYVRVNNDPREGPPFVGCEAVHRTGWKPVPPTSSLHGMGTRATGSLDHPHGCAAERWPSLPSGAFGLSGGPFICAIGPFILSIGRFI